MLLIREFYFTDGTSEKFKWPLDPNQLPWTVEIINEDQNEDSSELEISLGKEDDVTFIALDL